MSTNKAATLREATLIDVARQSAAAAETARTELLEKLSANERELASVERAIASAVDADDLQRLIARRAALATVIGRARSAIRDADQKRRDTATAVTNLENEARKLGLWLAETSESTQTDAELLTTAQASTVKSLADLTGKPQAKLAVFVNSYLQLASGDARKAAIGEFFSDWIRQQGEGFGSGRTDQAAFLSVHTTLSELLNDHARGRQRTNEHRRKIETSLARLVKIVGPIDVEALRREHRESQLLAALDPEVESAQQREFQAALDQAERAIRAATDARDNVRRRMQEHANTRKAREGELAELRRQGTRSQTGARGLLDIVVSHR